PFGPANAARQLGSAGSALAAVERAIADAGRTSTPAQQQQPAVAQRQPATPQPAASSPNVQALAAAVRQRLSEGKLIDPVGDSARDLLVQLRTTAPNSPEVEQLSRTLTTRLLTSGRQALGAKAFDRSAQLIAGARDVGLRYDGPAILQAERELTEAREAAAMQNNIVSASTLKRTRTVPPVYPEAARKRGVEGWVELAFTVQPNGTVEEIEVRNASPADVFDDAAMRAVRQWRFEPVVRGAERVTQRAMVRLKFEWQSP